MSVNKILALIGNILITVGVGIYGIMVLFWGIGVMAVGTTGGDSRISQISAVFLGFVLIILSLILLSVILLVWLGFSHLDQVGEQPWKIFFLVLGVLASLSVVALVPGVLFILVYALKEKNLSNQV